MDTYVCQNEKCSRPFQSKVVRRFCSVSCRASAPEFRKAILANLKSARAARTYPPVQGETRPCAQCGEPVFFTKQKIKRGAKTCSRTCYRLWMAARFDRSIGHIVELGKIQGFDEYLSGAKIRCLVQGCGWEGHNLATHMNQSHALTAEAVKAVTGFNRNTGLISRTLAKTLEGRATAGSAVSAEHARRGLNRVGVKQETRAEAREHLKKAAELRKLVKESE